MAIGTTKSHVRIEENRHWEDYQSLKQHWSKAAKRQIEYIFNGQQTSTNGAAEVLAGHGGTIAFLGANDIVYIAVEIGDATQTGKSVWIDYVSSTGVLYEAVETKIDSGTGADTEVPIGCESGTYVDTVASISGDALTMTGLDLSAGTANDLAGWYVVGSGDATHQEGTYLTILSNTAANPTVITCTTTPGANWDDDNVSVQESLNNDVFRIRRMYSEVEAVATKAITVCDNDATNLYAVIADTNSYGSAGSRYFSLSSLYRCFLGHVHLEAPHSFGADTDDLNYVLTITFTPKSQANVGNITSGTKDGAASDITFTKEFIDVLDWQPCIELEPATDVIFKIHKTQDQEHSEVTLDYTILEVLI